MEPGLLNDAKMRDEVKYLIEGEDHLDSVSFYVASMSWSIFGRLITLFTLDIHFHFKKGSLVKREKK